MKVNRKSICLESRWLVKTDQIFASAHFGAGRKKVGKNCRSVEPSRRPRKGCQEVRKDKLSGTAGKSRLKCEFEASFFIYLFNYFGTK